MSLAASFMMGVLGGGFISVPWLFGNEFRIPYATRILCTILGIFILAIGMAV